ncbi:MAG: transketolase [Planctomycetota bacterium]
MSGQCAIDDRSIQTIRFLSMEGVQAANSGHPGMPMGMAAAAYALWQRHLKFDPSHPDWINRDRFVLSAGHGSMLLYSLLHLFGYDVSLEDLKQFRQWSSKTPGHPEYGHTSGVEVTTGPLGQGVANAVGMAIAQKYLAARYNKESFSIFDYNIYAIAGDGCLQEGVSSEASSLAGHLGLDNLIIIYDDNHITIDGDTSLSFSEDVVKRYQAYGWNTVEIAGDGNDIDALSQAVQDAQQQTDAPTLIKFRSHIGFGSPNLQDSHAAHGSPLGEDEIKLIKTNFGWDPDEKFSVPAEVADHCGQAKTTGAKLSAEHQALLDEYAKAYPELAKELSDLVAGKITVDDSAMAVFDPESSIATRSASGKILNALMPSMPWVLGGSADLTPSNNTHFAGAEDFQKDNPSGRYLRYGVREHAMGAIMNGIAVSGILRPYAGTFLVFADYMRGAIRVAALSKYPTVFLFTHDSIGVGEDGPTHQPVETVASLRIIPNLLVFRPADANETVLMWKYILENNDAPAATALTRQNLPVMDPAKYPNMKKNFNKGAYVLIEEADADVLLLASGSEVQLAVAAYEKLAAEGVKAQVVSMPCWELFEKQDAAYKESVLPAAVKARVGIEAALDNGWWKYLGTNGEFVGMTGFGASAPGGVCFEKFGITMDAVVAAAKKSMAK